MKPSAKSMEMVEQLEKYGLVKVVEILDALDDAAQQDLVEVDHSLVSVAAPDWLNLTEMSTPVIAPKPSFRPLD